MEEGIATLSSFNAAERQAAIQRQLAQQDLSNKDKDTAFIIELVLGLLGLLGIGYMYTGLTNAGIARLIGNWIYLTLLWGCFLVFSTVTFGFGACLFFVPLILQAVVAFFSADDLKKSMAAVKSGAAGGGAAGFGGYLEGSQGADPALDREPFPGIEGELEQDRLDATFRRPPAATPRAETPSEEREIARPAAEPPTERPSEEREIPRPTPDLPTEPPPSSPIEDPLDDSTADRDRDETI